MEPKTILVVEDNPDDVFFMQRAVRKTQLQLSIQVAEDGQAAKDYLAGLGRYADRSAFPLPELIFLDLKLPYVSGFELLEWLHTQETLQGIPVAVLTSSPEERDRKRAEDLGARMYLVKPPSSEMVLNAVRQLKRELCPAG